ncbi:MAG: hypothetical protein HN494_05565, partial [Opitutae bacterium]|nr:hypothetical protein [Opitutae bacterium]
MNTKFRLFGTSSPTTLCIAVLVFIATTTAFADNRGEQGHDDGNLVNGEHGGSGNQDGGNTAGDQDEHAGHDERNATSERDDYDGHDERNANYGSGDGGYAQPERQGIPRDEVQGFVGNWLGDKDHYEGAKVMWAEKQHDLADDDNFVYEIGLDNGVALYFDKNKTFLHSALNNEFADHEVVELKADEVPQDVKDAIASAHP